MQVKFLTLDGGQEERIFEGLEATCVHHEIYHLDGILFWDHISLLKRNMLKRKLSKVKKERERDAKQG